MIPVPRHKPYRNNKILRAARGEMCTVCFKQDETIVAAHSNASYHGRGSGLKADDCFVAFLCQRCHDIYDGRGMIGDVTSKRYRQEWFDVAMAHTWKRLLEKGVLR